MDFQQFLIAALRMGSRIEIHGPGSTEELEHEQEEAEHGEGDEEGEPEGGAEAGEEPEAEGGPERRTGYNQAAPDSVRAALLKAAG